MTVGYFLGELQKFARTDTNFQETIPLRTDVICTLYERCCKVLTSFQHPYNVHTTSCASWARVNDKLLNKCVITS